jgi:hypothetical protein
MTTLNLSGTPFDGADRGSRPARPPHVYPEGAPWPSGEYFGYEVEDLAKSEKRQWYCRFLCAPGGYWFATFQDGSMADTSLFGSGDSPRESFYSLVERFKVVNGGSLTPSLADHIPALEYALDQQGL